jgi:hypothetical protein
MRDDLDDYTTLRRFATVGIAAAAVVLGAGSALAAGGDFSKLAERLADLRSEVDELTSEVETKKNRLQSRLRSIQRQKADIERKIEKEKMRVERLRKSLKEHREQVEADREAAEQLQPAVVRSIDRVRESVESGPPFKKSKRRKQLDDLEKQMKEGMRAPQKTASRLWQFVEDELRLGRENGTYSQVIRLDGEEVLAEVARLGMVALYFETDQGRVGVAERTEDGWSWRTVESDQGREQIEKLFESFQKNIRVGYFEVPNGFDGIRRVDEEGT